MTIAELTKVLYSNTGWSKNTIIILLKRMKNKGVINYSQNDRNKRFYMVINRTETEIQATNDFIEKIYHGDAYLLINNLLKSGQITKEQIEKIAD